MSKARVRQASRPNYGIILLSAKVEKKKLNKISRRRNGLDTRSGTVYRPSSSPSLPAGEDKVGEFMESESDQLTIFGWPSAITPKRSAAKFQNP